MIILMQIYSGKKASGAERKNTRKLDTSPKIGAEGPVFVKEIKAAKERLPAQQ